MAWLSQRGYATACVMFIAGWCLLSSPWLSGAVTIPYDAKAHFQAQVQFLAHAIHSGQSPFWTPNVFAGSPQIADPQSLIFSPALLLALISPTPSFRAVDAMVLITLGFGGLAVIGFFRDRGWHPAGAVVAALAFAFGASAAWRIQHVGQIDSYVFFAVTLWLLARALDRASWAWGLAAGTAAGLMVVKPDQVGFLGAFILAGYIVDHLLRAKSPRGEILRAAPPLAAATVVGALIVTAPLLLTFLFASDSNRPDFGFVEATRGSLHPASLLTSVIADLFGAFDPKVEYWGPSSSAWDPNDLALAQNMGQVYLGALPALAIIAAGLARGALFARPMRYFTFALALVTVYALGRHTPAFHWIFDHVPGVSFFRRPADATFMIGALGAIVAGYCVHDWLTRPAKLPAIVTGLATIVPIAAIVFLSLAVATRIGRFDAALAPVLSSLAWLAAAGLLMIALRRVDQRAAALAIVVPAALLVADLRIHNGPNESTALPPSYYDVLDPATKNETVRFLKERMAQKGPTDRRDRVELVGLGFAWPNAGLVHGFDHTLGYNPFRLAAFSEASGAGDGIAGPKEKNFTAIFPRYNCRLANLLGLRYVVSSVPIEQVDTHFRAGDLQLIKRTQDGYIYENPRARPRVIFAREWRLTDFDAIMETGRWPEFDSMKTVLLDGDPAAAHPEMIAPAGSNQLASAHAGASGDARLAIAILPPRSSEAPPSKVSIARYENTEIEITVEAGEAGFVVLNDIWHPWWTATLDGKPAPILKANVLFRAVQTPAGKHTLRFSFKPLDGALAELAGRMRDDE